MTGDGHWVEVPQPPVLSRCKVCDRIASDWMPGLVGVVSPSGIEHLGNEGDTLCGHDATGEDWWWPL